MESEADVGIHMATHYFRVTIEFKSWHTVISLFIHWTSFEHNNNYSSWCFYVKFQYCSDYNNFCNDFPSTWPSDPSPYLSYLVPLQFFILTAIRIFTRPLTLPWPIPSDPPPDPPPDPSLLTLPMWPFPLTHLLTHPLTHPLTHLLTLPRPTWPSPDPPDPPPPPQVRLVRPPAVSGALPRDGSSTPRLPMAVYGVQDLHDVRVCRRRGQDDLLRLLR